MGTLRHHMRTVGAFDVPKDLSAPSLARRVLRPVVARWLLPGDAYTAELLSSELVTNAVCHGSGPVGVRVLLGGHVLRVEVTDHSPVLPRLAEAAGSDGGFGIRLVQQLARSSGWKRDGGQKIVWFEVPLAPTDAAA